MLCKYCFQTDHDIETCKTILCKICKETGHPHWLCKNGKRKQDKRVLSNSGSSVVSTTTTNNTTTPRRDTQVRNNSSLNNLTKSETTTTTTNSLLNGIIKSEGFNTSVLTNETRRDVSFYTKQSQRKWADIL